MVAVLQALAAEQLADVVNQQPVDDIALPTTATEQQGGASAHPNDAATGGALDGAAGGFGVDPVLDDVVEVMLPRAHAPDGAALPGAGSGGATTTPWGATAPSSTGRGVYPVPSACSRPSHLGPSPSPRASPSPCSSPPPPPVYDDYKLKRALPCQA
eukprot:TRINITY_DN5133_c0_g1_i1.p3 TRINITY_DN5133_c0_g1~~TRINITY_DN5133_c0_g1_i1.p3  ORF type:complete len:157 (+),score=14.32 TRINITY_DN5133_c0_g1_i1:1019-1489(+)